jgi:hypothetical protein
MRKLILLALGGAAAAYASRSRARQSAPSPAGAPAGEPAPRPPRTEAATADTVETEALVSDAAPDDAQLHKQGDAEGSGDAEERVEKTEDEGR